MKQKPLISIIVPSRDGRVDFLRAQLTQQTFKNWELIVNTEPPTPGHARNQGALEAQGSFLIFFDDDVHLSHKNFLSEILKALMTIGPRSVVGVPCKIAPDASGFQKKVFSESFHISESKEKLKVVPWLDTVNGRCMAMRRDTFCEMGGFDPLLISGEDPELLYRVWRNGGKIYMLSNIWVHYYPPKSLKVLYKKTLWYARGNAQFARKHPESLYRPVLKNKLHAAGLLLLHSLALLPLIFIKVSFHTRFPKFEFRPVAALLTYIGTWVYCLSWFKLPPIPKDSPYPLTPAPEAPVFETVGVP